MHLGARMIERRDAEEVVLPRLAVVVLLDFAGMHEAAVRMDDGFREASRARREVDCGVVFIRQRNVGGFFRAIRDKLVIRFREGRAVFADVEQRADFRNLRADGFDAADEFRPEDEHFDVRQIEAVFDFIRRVAEVQRHGHAAAFENAEIDGQPFEAVHEQNADFGAFRHAARQQEVGETIGLLVELGPCHFGAEGIDVAAFDQGVFTPIGMVFFKFLWVDFDKRHVISVKRGVFLQDFRNRHDRRLLGFNGLRFLVDFSRDSRDSRKKII